MPDNYHHGDLPSTLRAATVELVAERGPSGFSLREVARRAGVSHAAPASPTPHRHTISATPEVC